MQLDPVSHVDASPGDGLVPSCGDHVGADGKRRLQRARHSSLQHVAGERAYLIFYQLQ